MNVLLYSEMNEKTTTVSRIKLRFESNIMEGDGKQKYFILSFKSNKKSFKANNL